MSKKVSILLHLPLILIQHQLHQRYNKKGLLYIIQKCLIVKLNKRIECKKLIKEEHKRALMIFLEETKLYCSKFKRINSGKCKP